MYNFLKRKLQNIREKDKVNKICTQSYYHKKYIDFYKIIEYYLSEGGKNEKKFNS